MYCLAGRPSSYKQPRDITENICKSTRKPWDLVEDWSKLCLLHRFLSRIPPGIEGMFMLVEGVSHHDWWNVSSLMFSY